MKDSLTKTEFVVLLARFVDAVNDILRVLLNPLARSSVRSIFLAFGGKGTFGSTHLLKIEKQIHSRIHRTNNPSRQSSNNGEDEWKLLHQVTRSSRRLYSLDPEGGEIQTIQMVPAAIQSVQRNHIRCQTHIDLAHWHRLARLLEFFDTIA
jgi:hypothetical protein